MFNIYLTPELNQVYNQQKNNEIRNSEVYRAISCFFKTMQLTNLANKFEIQMNEELTHALKFTNMINDRVGGNYIVMAIPDSPYKIETIEDCVSAYVAIEKLTSEEISTIYDLVINQKSYLDLKFIQEMLDIQIEETDGADKFAKNFKNVTDYVLWDSTFAN